MLASTVTIPLFGKVCDKFGYRKNYLIGGMLFFLGTLGVAALQVCLLKGMKILFIAIFTIAIIAFLIQFVINIKATQEVK